jgi:hypothetical protein
MAPWLTVRGSGLQFNPQEPLKLKLMLTGEPLTLGQVFWGGRACRRTGWWY